MKTTTPQLKDFEYGLIAYTLKKDYEKTGQLTVLHFCGYLHPITNEDIKMLETELDTDKEFNLVGRINKDVFIMEATPEMVKFYTGKVSKKNKVTFH